MKAKGRERAEWTMCGMETGSFERRWRGEYQERAAGDTKEQTITTQAPKQTRGHTRTH